MPRYFRALAAALILLLPAAAGAETRISQRYDVIFAGIKAGEAAFEAILTDRQYSIAGQLRSTGLLRAVANVRYAASTVGRIARGRFVPIRYRESENTGSRVSEAVMEYRRGVPQVKSYNPPRDPSPVDVDPRTQGDTVDPATAVFLALSDVPAASACRFRVTLFDGARRSRIVIGNPMPKGDGLRCSGEYQRLAGYYDWEVAERRNSPFTILYRPVGGGMLRVDEVRIATPYGTARLKRR